ncbi:hypothetical protein PR202_gb26895 [Eleusine coracana subsp. coracana]|uniref:Uncharacterized protein n=1 Tax=Eleusine coracana subsp. coracana TaxID=191504 RepID=A0AAV5FT13_ELECO|nr:hypothetical protein PR202_gb26895 [Eleusine coracana subsp. coracana]
MTVGGKTFSSSHQRPPGPARSPPVPDPLASHCPQARTIRSPPGIPDQTARKNAAVHGSPRRPHPPQSPSHLSFLTRSAHTETRTQSTPHPVALRSRLALSSLSLASHPPLQNPSRRTCRPKPLLPCAADRRLIILVLVVDGGPMAASVAD